MLHGRQARFRLCSQAGESSLGLLPCWGSHIVCGESVPACRDVNDQVSNTVMCMWDEDVFH